MLHVGWREQWELCRLERMVNKTADFQRISRENEKSANVRCCSNYCLLAAV